MCVCTPLKHPVYDPGESTSGEITSISHVVVGLSKESIDSVDSELACDRGCGVFGRFVMS